MLRSFAKMRQVDPGFVPQRVMAMKVALNWSKYPEREQVRAVSNRILEKIQSEPGVLSAAIASSYPLDPDAIAFGGWNERLMIEGRTQREGERPPLTALRCASPDYFKTLGIPLVKGRTFQASDNEKAPRVAVINGTLARLYWRDQDPIGHRISVDGGDLWMTVVGIVGDVKELGLNKEVSDELYVAQAQSPALGSVLVRTSQEGISMSNQMRRAVRDVDPQTAIPNVETLEQARTDSMASPRVMTDLLGIFAALALAIAAFGIGGILALSVNQRLNEIGIRIALGATPADVLFMILRRGMGLVVVGLAIGVASALGLTRLMKTVLFEISPADSVTFTGVSLILATAALLACYIPARRALRIDPLSALRSQ